MSFKSYTPQEHPLTKKGARALARLIIKEHWMQSSPDPRPLAKYVLKILKRKPR